MGREPIRAIRRRGLTLPEVAGILFLLAAVALVAVPGFLSTRIVANEEGAIALLNRISDLEEQYLDRSGGKSYAFLRELLGQGDRRKEWLDAELLLDVEPDSLQNDTLTVGGYHFVIYIPDERRRPMVRPELHDESRSPKMWVAYAWPIMYGQTGRQVFAADWQGRLWGLQNAVSSYSGLRGGPPAGLLASRFPVKDQPFRNPGRMMMRQRWELLPTP